MKEPKFKVGDKVYIKDDLDEYVSRYIGYETIGNPKPRTITIVGRMIEECEGGTQIHYRFIQLSGWIPEMSLTNEFPELPKK